MERLPCSCGHFVDLEGHQDISQKGELIIGRSFFQVNTHSTTSPLVAAQLSLLQVPEDATLRGTENIKYLQ